MGTEGIKIPKGAVEWQARDKDKNERLWSTSPEGIQTYAWPIEEYSRELCAQRWGARKYEVLFMGKNIEGHMKKRGSDVFGVAPQPVSVPEPPVQHAPVPDRPPVMQAPPMDPGLHQMMFWRNQAKAEHSESLKDTLAMFEGVGRLMKSLQGSGQSAEAQQTNQAIGHLAAIVNALAVKVDAILEDDGSDEDDDAKGGPGSAPVEFPDVFNEDGFDGRGVANYLVKKAPAVIEAAPKVWSEAKAMIAQLAQVKQAETVNAATFPSVTVGGAAFPSAVVPGVTT